MMTTSTTQQIAELNDLCRKAMRVAGRVFRTQGIAALPLPDQSAVFENVDLFDSFTEGSMTFALLNMKGSASFGRSITTPQKPWGQKAAYG